MKRYLVVFTLICGMMLYSLLVVQFSDMGQIRRAEAVTLLSSQGRSSATLVATIAASATTSSEVDLEGFPVISLVVPTITTGTISFQAATASGGTFYAVKGEDLVAFDIDSGTGALVVSADDLTALSACRYVKLVTSATQAATRTFTFLLKS
mgnify:CR=1 FL=1